MYGAEGAKFKKGKLAVFYSKFSQNSHEVCVPHCDNNNISLCPGNCDKNRRDNMLGLLWLITVQRDILSK